MLRGVLVGASGMHLAIGGGAHERHLDATNDAMRVRGPERFGELHPAQAAVHDPALWNRRDLCFKVRAEAQSVNNVSLLR